MDNQKMRFEKGENEQVGDATHNELINGVEYANSGMDEVGENIIRFFYSILGKYRLNHRPLDRIGDPNETLVIEGMENTQLKPALTMTMNGQTFPDWVIEIANPEDEEMTYLAKTGIYKEAGVREYWIIDPDKKVVLAYFFEKNGLIPAIYDSAQRIRVAIYKDLFISYSDIFKNV